MLKKFNINKIGRDFFVGDIHGHFTLLESKLADARFNPETDRLFAVGDLVDRGPESIRVAHYLAQPWFHSIRGNHEQFLIDYTRIYKFTAIDNGSQWFVELSDHEKSEFQSLFSSLALAFEIETIYGLVGLVHADVPYGDWDRFTKSMSTPYASSTALWSRTRFDLGDTTPVANIDAVIVGHSPQTHCPRRLGNVINIDGGVYKDSGQLTLITHHDLNKGATSK